MSAPPRPALVFERERFIYVQTAKVACSSIKLALGTATGTARERIEDWLTGSVPLVDLTDAKYAGYFKFSFVRNPFDRSVSCWENKFNAPSPSALVNYAGPLARALGVEKVSFEQFVEHISRDLGDDCDVHWRSLTASVCDETGTCLVDFVGRFERLAADFAEVSRIIGIDVELPHMVRSAAREHYAAYYTDRTRTAVARRYESDLRTFEYSF